jgi:23S rRNA (uracil1939-C5)-methyltransferase
MNLQPESFDLKLEKLTYGGEAMGRLPDSRAVFVPFGLPGERVRVRLVEEKKKEVANFVGFFYDLPQSARRTRRFFGTLGIL